MDSEELLLPRTIVVPMGEQTGHTPGLCLTSIKIACPNVAHGTSSQPPLNIATTLDMD